MDPASCFPETELARLASGAIPQERLTELEAHLVACTPCRAKLGSLLPLVERAGQDPAFGDAPPAGTQARILKAIGNPFKPALRIGRRAAVLAASLLLGAGLASLAIVSWQPARFSAGSDRLAREEGIPIRGYSELLQTDGASSRTYRLPDGSRLDLQKEAKVRIHPPREGEQVHLELLQGSLQADVVPGRGTFRVSSAAGEIQVLGTRFRAAVLWMARLPLSEEPGQGQSPGLDALCVEVAEGKVALVNRYGQVPVAASGRGLALADRPPAQLEGGGSRLDVARKLLPVLERENGQLRVRPGDERQAEFMAALFWSLPSGSPGQESLNDREHEALAFLERMGSR